MIQVEPFKPVQFLYTGRYTNQLVVTYTQLRQLIQVANLGR